MPKFNIDETGPTPGPETYFVGKVHIRAVINDSITKDIEVFLVSFEDGARTKVHYHDSDQVLMAAVQTQVRLREDGKAQVTFGEVQSLKKGDFVCIPAFSWHWHGAQKNKNFSHYQVKRLCKTVWLE